MQIEAFVCVRGGGDGGARKLENRVWGVMALCGAVGVVWWVATRLLPMFR
ncbi:MAG: hypothetical protein ACO34E_18895 [Limisphaerales bacterium]